MMNETEPRKLRWEWLGKKAKKMVTNGQGEENGNGKANVMDQAAKSPPHP